jgi:hypothetical protein
MLHLIVFKCRRCGVWLAICRSCYRNHRYCSKACSAAARREGKQAWHRQHRLSEEGRKDHRDQERARRLREKAQRESMGRQTSPASEDMVMMAQNATPPGQETGCEADHAEEPLTKSDADSADSASSALFFPSLEALQAASVHRCAFCGRPGVLVAGFERRPTGRLGRSCGASSGGSG